MTATGLDLLFLGGMAVTVDGEDPGITERLTYKGMMVEGVPNLAIAIGYTNASWTLKCDLTCDYVCRMLNHMRDGRACARPRRCNTDPDVGGPGAARPVVGLRAAGGRPLPQAGDAGSRGRCTRAT